MQAIIKNHTFAKRNYCTYKTICHDRSRLQINQQQELLPKLTLLEETPY